MAHDFEITDLAPWLSLLPPVFLPAHVVHYFEG